MLEAAAAPQTHPPNPTRATMSETEHRVAAKLQLGWVGFATQWLRERWVSPHCRDLAQCLVYSARAQSWQFIAPALWACYISYECNKIA